MVDLLRASADSPLCWLWPCRWSPPSCPSSSSPLSTKKPVRPRRQEKTPQREKVLTESFVHHGLLLLFLALLVHQRAEGVPAPHRRRVQRQIKGRRETEDRRKTPPLVIGRRAPQEHDDQQDGGEQEAPEGVVDPQFPPVLETKTFIVPGGREAGTLTVWFTKSYKRVRTFGFNDLKKNKSFRL